MFNKNGVVECAYFSQLDREEDLNKRLYERNLASGPVSQSLDVRPTPTKYVKMPMVNLRKPTHVQCDRPRQYNNESTFLPSNRQAPWNGFASHIDTETTLRNQWFALQKCDQSQYIPGSQSSLYQCSVPQTMYTKSHGLLFTKEDHEPFNPNTLHVGGDVFANHTRVQRIAKGSEKTDNK